MGTVLQISNPKLSFLQKITAIHFPTSGHEWLATVGATMFIPNVGGHDGQIVVSTISGTAFINYTGGVQTVFDPSNILSVSGSGFNTNVELDQFGTNPAASLNTILQVTASGDCSATVECGASANTSGRPGGDFSSSASAPDGFEVAADGTIITPGDGLIHLSAGAPGFNTRASFQFQGSASNSGASCTLTPSWS